MANGASIILERTDKEVNRGPTVYQRGFAEVLAQSFMEDG
jgi:hypothetical protein